METLARQFTGLFRRGPLANKPLPEPEPLYPSRPMTSFFASLSAEQKTKLRDYRGEEGHGDDAYCNRPSAA